MSVNVINLILIAVIAIGLVICRYVYRHELSHWHDLYEKTVRLSEYYKNSSINNLVKYETEALSNIRLLQLNAQLNHRVKVLETELLTAQARASKLDFSIRWVV